MITTTFSRVFLAAGLALALLVVGCSGSGGSDGAAATGGTGNVAVLLTDAPTDIYEEIHVTITSITLLPPDEAPDLEAVVLFEGDETIDLLQLRDHAELFEVAEDVPVGEYEKVRLAISQVEVVDTDTDPETRQVAMLPSGRIDVLTREGLPVSDGNILYLELDVDTEQSVLIVRTGSGELIFRPVVFATVYEEGEDEAEGDDGMEDADESPLLSVRGLVRETDTGLAVCPSTQAAEPACVRLAIGDASALFDEVGDPVGTDVLTEGVRVVAMGLLTRDPGDGRRVLQVLGLVLGTRPTVGTRGGEAATGVDAEGVFTLRDGRTVALDDTTPVVDGDGMVLGAEAIEPGQPMTLFGLVTESPLAAALVVLRDDDEDDADDDDGGSQTTLRGELVSVDTADTLQISVDGVARAVRLGADGELVISGPATVEEGALEDLIGLPRVRIVARGTEGDSYFEANLIVAIILDADDDVVSDEGDEG